nr:DEAD/DEAH box helicase [Acidobacteriota bacterium]
DDAGQPDRLVAEAIAALVDQAVRERLAGSGAPLDLLSPRRGRPPRVLPAAERWLTALTAPDGRLPVDGDPAGRDVLALSHTLEDWDAVGAAAPGAARALFRLTEPGEPADDEALSKHTAPAEQPWRLEFLLQSSADQSLQFDAEQVWTAPAGLHRWLNEPQELLLAELGRASTVYPELGAALRSARPTGWDLDTEGAHRFLTTGAALLDSAGFGVQLPGWWDRANRIGLVASGSSTPSDAAVVPGGLGREVIADFRWTLAVGDEVLDEAEIADLVAAKASLVRLRGQWVVLDPERLRRGLEFLRRPRSTPTAADLLALAAQPHTDTDLPLPVVDLRIDGWVGDVLAGTAATTLRPVEPPDGFAARLRPYQARGLAWLDFLSRLGLGACLADDMGLGKTIQLLALEATDRAQAPELPPTLLICPTSLVGNWQREAAKFAPSLRIHAHHGAGRPRGTELAELLRTTDVVISTYGTAVRDAEELAGRDWHRLVLDEAQALKNSQSLTRRAIRGLPARHRIALTGTPLENRLSDLWSLMDVLNPGLLGSADAFRSRFAIPVERDGDPEAAELLRRITRPYLLRRVKTDPTIIDDLPEKIEMREDYRLTREQASLYRTVVDDMMERIEGSDGIQRRGNVLAAMIKLKQVCDHPALLLHDGSAMGGDRSGKVERVEELLTEILAEGDKVLCFTQFTEFGTALQAHLSARFDQEVLFLHGGVPRSRRDEMVARFQSADGPSIFLLSLKAGGTGLNLTAANHVLHLDRWWNPAVENQATDRAFRIGQRKSVQVRKFTCAGTLEEHIDTLLQTKRALADLVVGDGEGWLSELSTDQLRELFTLGAEATVE